MMKGYKNMGKNPLPRSPLDWESPAYQADGYFDWAANLKILRGLPVRQEIPNLEEVLASYRKVIQECSPTFFIPEGQNFATRVYLDPPGNYYDVSWDVEKIKEMVRKRNLRPFLVPVKEPSNEVDWDYAKKLESDEPILMVDYMPTGEFIIVDGNHRMAKRYLENPNGLIEAYVLNPRDQIFCFCSDLFLYWFMVHHNINVLMNYIIGNTNELLVGDSSDFGYASIPDARFHDPRWGSFLFHIEPLPKVNLHRL